jgi:hypothetical protein
MFTDNCFEDVITYQIDKVMPELEFQELVTGDGE